MTFTYPVIVTRKEDGTFEGEFPDLAMCTCSGKTLFDCLEDAREQAFNWIDLELNEDDPHMPAVTDLHEIQAGEGQEVRNIMIHYRFFEGWDE